METSTVIQIAVSVSLILGAAGIALLCDYLKRKNEQLREAMVELQGRRTVETPKTRRPTSIVAQSGPLLDRKPVPAPEVAPAPPAPVVADGFAAMPPEPMAASEMPLRAKGRSNGFHNSDEASDGLVRKPRSSRTQRGPMETAPVAAVKAAAELTSLHGRRASAIDAQEAASKEALAIWLNRRAAARAEARSSAAPRTPVVTTEAIVEPAPILKIVEPVVEPIAEPVAPVAVVEEQPIPEVSEPVAIAAIAVEPKPIVAPVAIEPIVEEKVNTLEALGLAPVEIDAFLWESLISGKPVVRPVVVEAPVAAPVPQLELIRSASANSHDLVVPAGMHDESLLARLLEIEKPFTGLVVCIGMNQNDGRSSRGQEYNNATADYVKGMLHEKDFACRTAGDEFLMICPGQQGADAQRRLSNISERLWDYQLRGIGASSILFSWGGVDVQNEPLSDAIASATERMNQTKRSRKTVSMDSVSQRKKAV